MRTAIFVGLVYIGDSLFKSAGLPIANLLNDRLVGFYGILMLVFMFMDVTDFIKKLTRD